MMKQLAEDGDDDEDDDDDDEDDEDDEDDGVRASPGPTGQMPGKKPANWFQEGNLVNYGEQAGYRVQIQSTGLCSVITSKKF